MPSMLIPPPRPPVPHPQAPKGAPAPGGRSLVLTDEQLMMLTMRGDVLGVFPQFRTYRPSAVGGCKCSANSALLEARTAALTSLKALLLGFSEADRNKLKKALNVSSLVLFTAGPRGAEKHTL